jgi:hypothetical protein
MHTGFLSENLKGRDLRRPWCRWEDNIRIYVKEIWWEGVDCMHLAQDKNQWWALVNMVMNESSGSIVVGRFLG